ncbi:MAG: HpcH/HpaI aldolase/citrate lyase family protein [Methylococcales bacterium]|nr:HpcH/HpaI aldolase/citrate lyase family protein [Methylococcales bacterium]MCK5924517.1 HpcH/HpaI aldolase/citrate lyase family protein [Methylococcales bacterium]
MQLGATLYIPAIKDNLVEIANGDKYPQLRSMVFCTEDSIHNEDLDQALNRIRVLLPQLKLNSHRLHFIRVRNPQILQKLLALPAIDRITGFVFPKLDLNNTEAYFSLVAGKGFKNMPTLETKSVFEQAKMAYLRDYLISKNYHNEILALRIGGNDLLQHLGLRRAQEITLYETSLGQVIYQLINTFKPYGFELTAPVFEHLNNHYLLQQETQHDISCGLIGKTAIHPQQIMEIESCYRVKQEDLGVANAILEKNAKAVFKMNDSMCEIATHKIWANSIIKRHQIYGLI